MDDRVHLKIKIKNLADEARTIRSEEQKLRGMDKWKLQHHRKTVVRDAARTSLIAYQIIRGKDWTVHQRKKPPLPNDMPEVVRMVKKFGSPEAVKRLEQLEASTQLAA